MTQQNEIANYQNIDALEVKRVRGVGSNYFKVRLGSMDKYGRYTFKPEPIPYTFKEINSDASIIIEPPSKLDLLTRPRHTTFRIYQRVGSMRLIVTRDANDTYLNLYSTPL